VTNVLIHAVWSTWQRAPSISGEIEAAIQRTVEAKCRELRCPAIAFDGTDDHVHLLARLHPTIPVARLVGEAKGVSAHLINHEIASGRFFRWQEGYYATSVDPDDLDLIGRYIRSQRQHHSIGHLVSDFELPDSY
jgi:REP element-mobilizing transposase RayT